jgi:hypothetical protein
MSNQEYDIELPTEPEEAVLINPATMGLFGFPKSGKTSAVLDLPDCLVIELEPRGADFKKGLKLKIPKGLGPLESVAWLRGVIKKIKDDGRPYKYVAIDTLTMVDTWTEWSGTERFMKSNAGKYWNRWNKVDHPDKKELWGKAFPFGDEKYESVQTMGEGYGYKWSRAELVDLYREMSDLGSICTIFVMHVTENKDTKNRRDDREITYRGIALTGMLKEIIARELDAIGYIYHQDGKTMINFEQNEEKVGGMRGASHLRGYNGPLDWNLIFKTP